MSKLAKGDAEAFGEDRRWWAIILLWTAGTTLVMAILISSFYPNFIWPVNGGWAVALMGIAIGCLEGAVIGPVFAWKEGSGHGIAGEKHTSLSHEDAIPLGSEPLISIDPGRIESELSEEDRKNMRDVQGVVPGANRFGRMVEYAAHSLGGGHNWSFESPLAFGGGCYIGPVGTVIRMGRNKIFLYGIEKHSQSEYPYSWLLKLANPGSKGIPAGFRLGPKGTKMFGPGPNIDPRIREAFHTNPDFQAEVLGAVGYEGLLAMFMDDLDAEMAKRPELGTIRDDPKTGELVRSTFRSWLAGQKPLSLAMGRGGEDRVKLLTANFSLRTEVNELRASYQRARRDRYEADAGLSGIIRKRARVAARTGMPIGEPHEQLISEQDQGMTT